MSAPARPAPAAPIRVAAGTTAGQAVTVVDEAARGRGAGRALMHELVERGRAAGLRSLELTSRPSRTAAIALYESVGFTKRETNVLRYAYE